MPEEADYQNAVTQLRDAFARRRQQDLEFRQFLVNRDEVT